jgi:hypothetical protein
MFAREVSGISTLHGTFCRHTVEQRGIEESKRSGVA